MYKCCARRFFALFWDFEAEIFSFFLKFFQLSNVRFSVIGGHSNDLTSRYQLFPSKDHFWVWSPGLLRQDEYRMFTIREIFHGCFDR